MSASPSRIFKSPIWLGYCHDGYHVVPFDQYLKIRPSSREQDAAKRLRQIAAETQSLLTFGLLEAVIGKHIPESVLVRDNESGLAAMTKDSLSAVLGDWVNQIRQSPRQELKPWLERIQKTLTLAHSMLIGFLRDHAMIFKPLGSDAPFMVCFIALVGEAIVNTTRVFPLDLARQGYSWSMIWSPPLRKTIVEEMIAVGWCPSIVHYLISTASVSALEYVSECQPTADGRHHDSCTEYSCATYHVNAETYVPRHTSACAALASSAIAHCEYISPSFTEVEQMILRDWVPVIMVHDEPEGNITLTVHRSLETPYAAISHVWADGLGSTTEKGLPACQLRHIASLVAKIRPGAAFWIDGICIPSAENVRKKAIGMMASTYSDADVVLVLDKGLQLCHSINPLSVKLLRVATSGWMRRLWTLQEAVLSKELHFSFADQIVALGDLIPPTNIMLIHVHLGDLASELFRMMKKAVYGSYSLGDVARSLQFRTTSRTSDETLAIASLLGSKPSVLVELKSSEERIMRMLQDVKKMPRNILFLSGEKLQIPGFRWAPKSFMSAHGGGTGAMLATSDADATLTHHGLQSIYFAILFPKVVFASGKPWKMKDKEGRFYLVGDVQPHAGDDYTCNMLLALDRVPRGSSSACIGVLRTGEHVDSNGTFTVYCTYVRRLIYSNVLNPENSPAESTVYSNLSGKLSVCVG